MIGGVPQDSITQTMITAWVLEGSLGVEEDRGGMIDVGSRLEEGIGTGTGTGTGTRMGIGIGIGIWGMVGPDDPKLGGMLEDLETGSEDESVEPEVEWIGLGSVMIDEEGEVGRVEARVDEPIESNPTGWGEQGGVEGGAGLGRLSNEQLEVMGHQAL